MEEFEKELDLLVGVSGEEGLQILQFFGSSSTLEALVHLSSFDINNIQVDFLKLLSLRPNIVNTKEEYQERRTALMVASSTGYTKAVELLIQHEADILITGAEGFSCLHLAVAGGHLDVVRVILNKMEVIMTAKDTVPLRQEFLHDVGPDIHESEVSYSIRTFVDLETLEGHTALMLACKEGHLEISKLLIENNANMKISAHGWNCLHFSARYGHHEVSRLMIESCYDLIDSTIRGKKSSSSMLGFTSLMLASDFGHDKVVKLLLEHKASVMMSSEEGWNCLHYATRRCHAETLRLILESRPDAVDSTIQGKKAPSSRLGFTPLMLACELGHEEAVKLLLEYRASIMMNCEEGWNALHYAARWGRFEASKLIVKESAEAINSVTLRLRTTSESQVQNKSSLMFACQYGHVKIVKILLDHRADVMIYSELGWNCLHYAAKTGSHDVVKLIVRECPNMLNSLTLRPKITSSLEVHNKSAFMLACQFKHSELVKTFLGYEADVMMYSAEGWNCLHYAARWGHYEVSKLLVKACAELINTQTIRSNKRDPDVKGKSAIMFASQFGHVKVLKTLLEHKADVTMCSEDGWNCLHYAARWGHSEVSRLILDVCADIVDSGSVPSISPEGPTKSALMLACRYGHWRVVSILLDYKANAMLYSEIGWNCLHYAARNGHFEASRLIIETCPEIINDGTLRMKSTVDSEYMNSNRTPLMLACQYGYIRIVGLLLKHKADVRMCTELGWNCLHYAGRYGYVEVSRLILEACAEMINDRTENGNLAIMRTTLMFACQFGHKDVVELLLEHKADVMIFSDYGWNCFHYAARWSHFEVSRLIIEACVDIINIGTLRTQSTPDKYVTNKTGLMLACESGHEQVVRVLLDYKADVMLYSEIGWNCLHYAAERGHSDVSRLLIQEFPQLRDSTIRGAKCPSYDSGKTAVMLASQFGNLEVVRTLLDHKADVMLCSDEGCNCLLYAARSNDLEVVKLIIEAVVGSVIDASALWWKMTLMWASEFGHLSVVSMLLNYKIDLTIQNGDGHNCLHLAAKNGHVEVLKAILVKYPGIVNSTTRAGETSLMLVAQKGDEEVAKILLEFNANVLECNEDGWNCLHFAASQGKTMVMREIFKHHDLQELVDRKTNKSGRTALILAAENGCADIVKLLLHNNCNEILCDNEGFSCLHVAAKNGHREVLSHLLSEEGDEDYWNEECLWLGDVESKIRRLDSNSLFLTSKRLELMEVRSYCEQLTALHMAGIGHHTAIVAFLERTYHTLALRSRRFLLDPVTTFLCYEAQSNYNLKIDDFFYGSPLSATPELLKFFRDSREEFMKPVRKLVRCPELQARNDLEEIWGQILNRNHEIEDFVADKADYDGLSTSNLLDLSGMVEANVAVIRYINARDITGRTALHYLAATCDCEHLKEIEGCRMAFQNILGTPFYDVVAADWRGYTPLHLAAYKKNSNVVKMFVTSTCSGEENRLMYNSKGAKNMNVEESLREAVRESGVTICEFYEPSNGHIHECHWQEDRDGIIPLHYAVEKYYPDYDGVVKLLVEASRPNLITKSSNFDSSFTIAMSHGAYLYNSGGSKSGISRDNILIPGLKHAKQPSNMNIKCQDDHLSMFRSLEKAAVLCRDDPKLSKEERNSIWVELIWSMREILEEQQIDADERGQMLKEMMEKGHCDGLTILHYAAFRGLLKELQQLLRVRELKEMVDCPCTVSGQTMMHFAVIEKHTKVVNWLRTNSYGRLDEEDKLGRTPYELLLEVMIASPSPELKNCEASLRGEKTIINYIEKQYRDRQIHVDAGNTALVGAALIASVTFAGWLQPPLGYMEYQQYTFPDSNIPESFAAVQQYTSVRVFWVFNSLSFFFAVATVVCGARAVLPASSTVFIAKEVRLIRDWLVRTSILLVISIVCVLGAFGAAGFAALPPDSKYQTSMTLTFLVGGSTCVVFLFFYFLRLNEIKHWFPSFDRQSIKLWLSGGHRELGSSKTCGKSGQSVQTKLYALKTTERKWRNLWGLM
ncbi:hypothetical protein Mapa_000481 [Marchantia paleacea]|nr:hypothetical protein Mapa_000481 [Marchantia paleacea]